LLRPAIRHVSAALLGLLAGIVLILGFAAWRLSQGHIAADAFRPAAEHWLAGLARGGRARVGAVDVVWFGASRSLGLQLRDVSLSDRQGRPVLRARRLEAGMAVGSLAGGSIAPGHVAADDFFAAVSVSPQGRYELGYEASGEPGPGSSTLLRFFDDLTGKPRLGRPLSFLQQVEFSNGEVALSEVGGPVSWRGHLGSVRFDKTEGRLQAAADMRVGEATLNLKAQGRVGLGHALVQVSTDKLDPARIFPAAGATAPISILDAPVGGKAWLSWANDRGVRGADVELTAGQGLVRLGGPPTPFRSGELRVAFDPASGRVLIQSLRASSDQADFDVKGQAWLTPESRTTGPARLELALGASNARLSLDPRTAPAELKSFALNARYTPKIGRLELNRLDLQLDGSPFLIQAVLQRPRGPRKWGLTLDARIPGMLSPRTVVALWPKEQSPDARDWIRDHVSAGRLGQAVFRIRTPAGGVPDGQPIREDQLRLTYAFDGADILAYEGVPVIHAARGSGALRGDEYDMTVQSASIDGVGLSQGVVQIPRLSQDRKRIYIDGRAVGDAQALLQVVDKSTGGMASHNGFEPARLGGQGDATFSLSRYLENGPGDFQAAYRGVVRNAKVTGATLGLTLKAGAMTLEGSGERFAAQGQVQLGPYRGPLRYETQFAGGRASLQRADLAGVVDASSLGFSGPAGATLPFSARFEQRGTVGTGEIRSKAFDGQTQWGGTPGRFLATGRLHAPALRSIGLPVGKGVPDQAPVRLALAQAANGAWSGSLDADAYSGIITVSAGSNPHFHYAAQLTPDEARRIGLGDEVGGGKVLPVSLDVATTGEAGAAAYGLGDWIGQVSWTQGGGARTQYHWRTTLTAADLHALGMPAALEPRTALPLDVTLVGDPAGGFTGSAQMAGGAFRFTGTPSAKGRRRMTVSGSIDGHVLSDLGLGPDGMISGPTGLSAAVDLGPEGVRGGHVQADLQHAAFSAPFVAWRKPAGRAMQISADFARKEGEVEASAVRGSGPGFDLNASGAWKAGSGVALHASQVRLEGAFDGSLELGLDSEGARISTRARYFDARRLLQQPDRGAGAPASSRAEAPAKPFHVDAQLAQVRVSESGLIHNVKIEGQVSPTAQRRIDVSIARDDGSQLVALKLYPDAAGMAVRGDVTDVGEAAFAVFGRRSFQGGKAEVTGHLVDGGADLKVEMTKVRLVRAPALAKILTVGSLHGMSDTLNGTGIEFTKVVAPVTIRGGKMSIARARATGPAMGITTSGVIDIDAHTVDLSGGIAPSYLLNSAVGAVPVVGNLFVSHKGEGMFGLTYSAKGAFAAPKIAVNPLSLAAPGILRRIFEGRSQAALSEPAG
jgi:hypothetical protein